MELGADVCERLSREEGCSKETVRSWERRKGRVLFQMQSGADVCERLSRDGRIECIESREDKR